MDLRGRKKKRKRKSYGLPREENRPLFKLVVLKQYETLEKWHMWWFHVVANSISVSERVLLSFLLFIIIVIYVLF